MPLDYDGRDTKRTLGNSEKHFLWERAGRKCENPKCVRKGRKLEFVEVVPGHKKAWANRGRTTLANSVCLCAACNKLQGALDWATFLKKQGYEDPKIKLKNTLTSLTIVQLKALATKHNIKLLGKIEETLFSSTRKVPTKSQYVNSLLKVATEKELNDLPKETPGKVVKRKSSW